MIHRKARVLYLSHAFMVGGAEEMVLNLVRHLPDRFEPAVMCINQAGPIGEEIRRTGVPFSVLGLTPGVSRPVDVLRLRDAVHAMSPTIVHTFLLTGSLYGRFAAMMSGVPIVIGTEVNIYEKKKPLHARLERWLMRGTDAVIASAESVKEHYVAQVGADPAKVEVIYNAVDWAQLQTTMTPEEFRKSVGVPLDAPAAGIIARLTEQKAHRVLFDAMALPELSALHLIVVGDGELRHELQSRAASLGIDHRVHFLGRAATSATSWRRSTSSRCRRTGKACRSRWCWQWAQVFRWSPHASPAFRKWSRIASADCSSMPETPPSWRERWPPWCKTPRCARASARRRARSCGRDLASTATSRR